MRMYKRVTAIWICAAMLAVFLPCAMPVVYGEDTEQVVEDNPVYIRLQSAEQPGAYISSFNSTPGEANYDLIKVVRYADDDSARWRIVPGLAGGGEEYISFEAADFSGYYLKQSDSDSRKLVLGSLDEAADTADFKRKATFCRESGLWSTSAQSYSYSLLDSEPKAYIRHQNLVMYIDPHNDNDGTKKDATFYQKETGESTGLFKLESACYGTDYFLRHWGVPLEEDGNVRLRYWGGEFNDRWGDDINPEANDYFESHWKVVPGLAGDGTDENCISFESVRHPGFYLKKNSASDFTSVWRLDKAQSSEENLKNATFIREEGLVQTDETFRDIGWHSYRLYGSNIKYLRNDGDNIVVKDKPADTSTKRRTLFAEVTDNRLVLNTETLTHVESVEAWYYEGGNVETGKKIDLDLNTKPRFPSGAKIFVKATAEEGWSIPEIMVKGEHRGDGWMQFINGGYVIMPQADARIEFLTEQFTPQPEKFNHPGIAVSMDYLDNMKMHIQKGDRPWIETFQSLSRESGAAKKPRILWHDGFTDLTNLTLLHNMIWDSNTAYLQTLMWYITGEEVYREYALKIIDNYSRTNSIRWYISDDRIRVSLAVDKICIAAEILRYADFNGAEELKWTEAHTEAFTRYLLLVRQKYDRYWHFMNQQNFCTSATIASAVFRNDWEAYKKGIQRATTNPELKDSEPNYTVCGGALCDRNGECKLHAKSGDILSQIREVRVDKSYRNETTISQGKAVIGREVEPNIQLMELGRDIGHAYCNIGHLSYDAHTALIQGTRINNDSASEKYGTVVEDESDPAYAGAVNMFEFADHRLIKGANYIVKYTLGYDVRYVPAYWGTNKWGGIEYYAYPSNERSGYEYWNRFDTAYAGIYNYYRYFEEGKAAVEEGAVKEDDMKYLKKAFVRTYPEMFFAEEFIGLGSLLYTNTMDNDYDVIEQKEFLALQNATVDADNPDIVCEDDGYLYTGGQYSTYLRFDLSQIEQKDMGELNTLGLEVLYNDKDPGWLVKVETELYTGDWEQSTATYNSLQSLTKITDVKPPKTMYLRNSFNSKHLLQEVIYELKAKGYTDVTFRLHQIQAEDVNNAPPVESTEKQKCARVLSLKGADNRHAKPRLVTHKLVPITEVPPPDESEYEQPGERLFTQKTNFKDFGYLAYSDSRETADIFRLTRINDRDENNRDIKLRYAPNSPVIYYLGEGDLTDLEKIYYWVGQDVERDITLYYTRADDDCLKTKQLTFYLESGIEAGSYSVKRYYTAGTNINKFIDQMGGGVLATGKVAANKWDINAKTELSVSENLPKGRYKVFMVMSRGDQAYIQFEYTPKWDISFNKTTKAAQLAVVGEGNILQENEEILVYAAVYAKDGEQRSGEKRLKEAKMKKLVVKQETQSYSMDFGDLADFAPEDEVKVFLWGEKQNPLKVNQYTVIE